MSPLATEIWAIFYHKDNSLVYIPGVLVVPDDNIFMGVFSTELFAKNYCEQKNKGCVLSYFYCEECEVDSLL